MSYLGSEERDSVPVISPGFRFCPPEEILVSYYLKKKIQGNDSVFIDIIPEIDVCKHEPGDLPAILDEPDVPDPDREWFFFSRPDRKYINSPLCNRATAQGFYKIIGKECEIKARSSQAVIGKKRTFTFYQGRFPKVTKTDWVMHEYSLTETELSLNPNQQTDLVLCRLKNKSANCKKLMGDSICNEFNSNSASFPIASSASSSPSSSLSTVSNFLTIKLDCTNYHLWRDQLVLLLHCRGLLSFVDGTSPCPPAFLTDVEGKITTTVNPDFDAWIQQDQEILSWLNSSLSPSVLATVARSTSARNTWFSLETRYASSSSTLPAPQHWLTTTGANAHITNDLVKNPSFCKTRTSSCRPPAGKMLPFAKEMATSSRRTAAAAEERLSLPVGFRFHPTEHELVSHYLMKKIQGGLDSHVSHIIPEIEICNFEPWDLPVFSLIMSDDEEWFFFRQNNINRTNNNINRINRTTNKGFWKITGKERVIKARDNRTVVGKKRILTFYIGRVRNAQKTNWVIHEYYIPGTHPNTNQRDFVLCRLKEKSGENTDAATYDEGICVGERAGDLLLGNAHTTTDYSESQSAFGANETDYGFADFLNVDK